jgi:hypothetical protein
VNPGGVQATSEHVEGLAEVMRCGGEEIEDQESSIRQGMDHQMRLVEQERNVAGSAGSPSHGRDAKGVEPGRARGCNEKPAEHFRIAELFGGHTLQIG